VILIFLLGIGVGAVGTMAITWVVLDRKSDRPAVTRRQLERQHRRNRPDLRALPFRPQDEGDSMPPPMDDFDRLETEDV
jgi:hypothetical protein